MKIEEISYGIAYQVTDSSGDKYIQVNKHLKEDPALYDRILKHEIEHMESPNKHLDFWIDFKNIFRKPDFGLFRFCLKHPSAFMCYSPVTYTKEEGIGINLFAFLFDFVFILMVCVAAYILLKIFLPI